MPQPVRRGEFSVANAPRFGPAGRIVLRWLNYVKAPDFVFGLLVLAVGGFLVREGGRQLPPEIRILRHGVIARGTVTERLAAVENPSGAEDPARVHYLRYLFTDARGVRHDAWSGKLRKLTFDTCREGDEVEVRYLPDRPTVNRLAGRFVLDPFVVPGLCILSGTLLCCFGGVFMARSAMRSRRRAALLGIGVPVSGQFVGMAEGSESGGTVTVEYRFADSSGAVWEGSAPGVSAQAAARFQPGDPILVVYDPAYPRRSQPDVHGIVALSEIEGLLRCGRRRAG